MNILVVSDDHGIDRFKDAYNKAIDRCGTIDAVFHAGDTERYGDDYYVKICKCPVYIVKGNNDYNDMPNERLVDIGGKRVFLTHGHQQGVYLGLQKLAYTAMEKGADIAIFGHTHIPEHASLEGLEIINPGSLSLPRRSRYGSFALLKIDDNSVNVEHVLLD